MASKTTTPRHRRTGIEDTPETGESDLQSRRLRSPLARKQLFFILLFSSIITLVGTTIQLYIEYQKDIGAVEVQFNQVAQGYLGSLTSSLWHLDDDQLELLMGNMLSMRDVVRLEIHEIDKQTHSVGEMARNAKLVRRTFDMIHTRDGRPEKIGTLHAIASLQGVHRRLGERLMIILTTQAIKTFLVSLFILAIIHFLVTRHLRAMADHVRRLDPSRPGKPLTLPPRPGAKDELDDVAGAIHAMEIRLKEHIDEQEQNTRVLADSENRLRRSQNLLKTVLSSLDEVVLLVEPQGKLIVDANAPVSRIFGYQPSDVLGRGTDFLHVDNERFQCFEKEAREAIGKHGFYVAEYHMRRKDGEHFATEHYMTKISGHKGTPEMIVSIIRDISHRKALEARIQQTRKLEAVGTLTGGIAHDFNNILGIIMGNAELAMTQTQPYQPGRKYLEEIMAASTRAKEVIAQLLSYGQKADRLLMPINLTPVVENTVKLLRASIPQEIDLHQYFEEHLATVEADPAQIHQAVLNLCTNACQSMEPQGGRLTIHLVNTVLTQPLRNQHINLPPGRYVQLIVSDTGTGIAARHLEKVFDPYFTTKEIGKGTGLGMAVVHGVVKTHHGTISLESTPGQGTRVSVYLPVVDLPVGEPSANADITAVDLPKGSAKILIVDDEPQMVQLGKTMMQKLGYEVETATRPEEAFDLISSAPSRLDLLITDWSMPGMSGMELAARIHTLRPDLPIVLCSGISVQVNMAEANAARIHHLLTKPYDLSALANILSAALSRGRVAKSP